MNELEKLREEFEERLSVMSDDLLRFESRMQIHINAFYDRLNRAREIERQAGIGEKK